MEPGAQLKADVRHQIYRLFLEQGHAPVPTEIAGALGQRPIDVERALQALHAEHMIVLAPGTPYIWMANPFSALPTPYEAIDAQGRRFWGNCIWDALGILVLVGSNGSVETACPDCAEPLTIEVEQGVAKDEGHVVHFSVPAAQWWDDIGYN